MTQNIPAINMIATGQRITDLRVAAGMSVRDLQDVFGFATPQALSAKNYYRKLQLKACKYRYFQL
jgi:hypothetical protein